MDLPAPLLFDLDGTLVDSALAIAEALTVVARARGGEAVTVETVRPLVSKGVTTLVSQALGQWARETDEDVAEFRGILRSLPADPACLYPEVVATLRTLAEAGHRLAVVTNKPEELSRQLLDQLGLSALFGAIVGGDTLPVCKPDPAPLRHALAALGEGADRAVMIGDSDVDIAAAQAAGVAFILFEPGYGPVDRFDRNLHRRFAHFADLPALVGENRAAA